VNITQEMEGIVILVIRSNEEHWLRIKYWSELEALRYSSDEINISVRFARLNIGLVSVCGIESQSDVVEAIARTLILGEAFPWKRCKQATRRRQPSL
jgi:hypothetical protein